MKATQVKTISAGFTYERGFLYQYQCAACGEWARENFAEGEVEKEDSCLQELHERCTCHEESQFASARTYQHKRKK